MPRAGECFEVEGRIVRLQNQHAADPSIWIALDDRGASRYIGAAHLETLQPLNTQQPQQVVAPTTATLEPPADPPSRPRRRPSRQRSRQGDAQPATGTLVCPACRASYSGTLGVDHRCQAVTGIQCRGCKQADVALLTNPPRQPHLCEPCIQRRIFICKACSRPQTESRYQDVCDSCNPMMAEDVWEEIGGIAKGNDIIVNTRSHRPFAVEIESFMDPDESVVHGDFPSGWDKGVDGSIRPDAGCRDASEFRSGPLRGDEGLRLLHSGVQRLRDLGYRANVSCGVHCHVSLLGTEPEDREALHRMGTWIQPDIFKLVAPSRADSRFCKKLTTFERDKQDKYLWMGLQSYDRHRTVEFRIHHGVTRPDAVVEYVRLCLRIVERGLKLGYRAQKPSGTMMDLLGLTAYEKEYWTGVAKRLHGDNVQFEAR